MNYEQAKNQFETSRKRKLENNTYLVKGENYYAIRLHETEIIKFYPDKTVLDSGGYKTVTTKDRLNRYSGFHVTQKNYVWSIGDVVFADDITYDIKADKWIGQGEKPEEQIALQKKVKLYAKKFCEKLSQGKIDKPSSGDCFYCGMVTVNDNIPLGEVTKDGGHILSHIKENYFVPSLLFNAVKMFDISQIAKAYIGDKVFKNGQDCSMFGNIALRQIETSITRYCKRQLNIG